MREKTVEEKRVAINRAATAAVAFLAGTRPTRSESDLPPRIELVRALAKGLRELEPENWVARLKPVLDEIARDAYGAGWPNAEEVVAKTVGGLVLEIGKPFEIGDPS